MSIENRPLYGERRRAPKSGMLYAYVRPHVDMNGAESAVCRHIDGSSPELEVSVTLDTWLSWLPAESPEQEAQRYTPTAGERRRHVMGHVCIFKELQPGTMHVVYTQETGMCSEVAASRMCALQTWLSWSLIEGPEQMVTQDTLVEMAADILNPKTDSRPALGGYAPGKYMVKCRSCEYRFMGDKRASSCADCAYAVPHPDVSWTVHGRINQPVRGVWHRADFILADLSGGWRPFRLYEEDEDGDEMETGPGHWTRIVQAGAKISAQRTSVKMRSRRPLPSAPVKDCNCWDIHTEALKKHGLQLAGHLSGLQWAQEGDLPLMRRLPLETLEGKKPKRSQARWLQMSHCPFCGQEYRTTEKK